MININIARTLIAKRSEKGITQEELANFMGVSKASVSKWEKGHSYPDITFLPQLAAYFDISLDELMGYEPQMTVDDIRKLNVELLNDFATKPFDETMNRCRGIVKKYYSCFPLLFQIAVLFSSYGSTSKDEEQKISILTEAKELFIRVKTLCDNAELKQLALHSEAACEMMVHNPNGVIALLENERRYSPQPSNSILLSQSYQMLGKTQEAKSTMQDSILDNIIALFFDITAYLPLCTDDIEHFEEICRRTIDMDKVFKVKELLPIAILQFYLAAAEGYLIIGDIEKSLAMLETYAEVATGDIFPLTLREDNFFNLINELRDRQLNERPFGMPEFPLDEQSIKQGMIDATVNNPVFAALHENKRFQDLAKRLKQML